MSRLVKAIPLGMTASAAAAANGSTSIKEYFERLGKYVPAEIIAAFMAMNGVLMTLNGNTRFIARICSFSICWIFTPIYFKLVSTTTDQASLRAQQIVSFFAFLVWAYATTGNEGVFGENGLKIYREPIGTAMIIVFSLISGSISPKKP